MRQIGILDSEAEARRFAAFLVTGGITAHAEQDGAGWAIWVRDENQIEQAREAFADYRRNPQDPRYQGVEHAADSILRGEERRREQARKNVIPMRGRWGRVAMRRRPLVLTLMALSIFVGMASNMGRLKNDTAVRTLLFCDTAHLLDEQWNVDAPQDRLIDIRRGELWRIITPIFVHYGPMHLAFNMIMLYQLGSLIEDRRGTWRIGLMIVVTAACSNTVQALVPMRIGGSPFAAGMSGVLYGLFGYIWMKSIFAPELGLAVSRSTVIVLMVWLFLGIAGALDTETASVANWTHGVGFLAGVAIGYGPELLRPFRTG